MYVDLNPIRAAMAETIEQSIHTSAYDRVKGEKGQKIDSAAFDLVPADPEQAAEEIRTTSVEQLRKTKQAKRRSPTGRRIRRDDWLAPLSMRSKTADDPESSKSGVRASDKGFLHVRLSEYVRLLRWTAKQRDTSERRDVPKPLQDLLTRLGIDLAMWRDLVWNFQRYFGKSSCIGSPDSMSQHAKSAGHQFTSGQRQVSSCFTSG